MSKDSSNSISKKRKNKGEMDTDEVYKKAVEFEEKEALNRKPSDDIEIYLSICNNIKKLLSEIFQLKRENETENKSAIIKKRVEICVQTAMLKKLNRLDKVKIAAARDILNVEKLKVDSINLQLQNLLYELNNVNFEHKKCTEYKSKDEDIELISIPEYLKQIDKSLTDKYLVNGVLEDAYKHEVHLGMLEHELNQRITLSNLCGQLENEKKQLTKDILLRKEKLNRLDPLLNAVIEATKPLQDHLGIPIDKTRAEHKLASLLPDVLYLLYCNGEAYKQVNEIGMSINIIGDEEEGAQYNEAEKVANHLDSDNENDSQDAEPVEIKKHRHRKSLVVDRHEEKCKKLLEAHPLSVEISMAITDGPLLKIKFSYHPNLKIVTALPVIYIPTNITDTSAREVLSGESVVNELFEGDFGIESPNASNYFQLRKLGLGSFETLVPKLGYAYQWAQRVCGLNFLNKAEDQKNERANRLTQISIESVLITIQKRLHSRYALAKQLQQIEQNCFLSIPDHIEYPKASASTLTKWVSINYQKFCQNIPHALQLVDANIVSVNDLYYAISIVRPKAFLDACVIIKNDYPQQAPIFIIQVNKELNAENSDEIRSMERAVNIGWENVEDSADWLLSVQIRLLCSFFDVYLETNENPGFSQSTVFFKKVAARNRRRPFKFRKIGNGIFTQY